MTSLEQSGGLSLVSVAGLLGYRAEIVVSIDVVAPPGWERDRRTTSTENGKREDKESREAGTIEGTGDQIRIIFEDAWAVVSKINLDEESSEDLAEENTSLAGVVGDVATVLNQLRHVDFPGREASNFRDELKSHRVSLRRSDKDIKEMLLESRCTHPDKDTMDDDEAGANRKSYWH